MLSINRFTGELALPIGASIGPDTTRDAFASDPVFAEARNAGSPPPYVTLSFDAGELDHRPLLASVTFYEQTLLSISLTIDAYGPGATWDDYSLESEARSKLLHEALLTRLLGEPTHRDHRFAFGKSGAEEILTQPVTWEFAWGRAISSHDSKGGGTYITLAFGNRMNDARRAFDARR
ncbi:MAG: hypothetical protein KDA33_17710 [Phycisphaerales bacterium]|nr:hypothetical protein [Phycisphaerales bacterium]